MRTLLAVSVPCLAGCIDSSSRIATELGRYGLDRQQAQCVGDRLESNLSRLYLQRVRSIAGEVEGGRRSGKAEAEAIWLAG